MGTDRCLLHILRGPQDQSAGGAAAKGDSGWAVLTSNDPAETQRELAAETADGRLAWPVRPTLLGWLGSYTGSPLRADESELGGQAPVGCWDPAGCTARWQQ